MTPTNYINSNGLGLRVNQLPSGTFVLYFSNGFISFCYTEDYFSSLIGPEVEPDKVVELINKMQERVNSLDDETVSHISFVLLEMVKVVNEATGMRQLLTKREALLVCTGFKTGEAYVCGKYGINE